MWGGGGVCGAPAVERLGPLGEVGALTRGRTVLAVVWTCGQQGLSAAEDLCFSKTHIGGLLHLPKPETIGCSCA